MLNKDNESIAITDRMENVQIVRMAAESYAATMILSLLYTIASYFLVKSVNLFPIEIFCVAYLVYVLSKIKHIRKCRPILKQGGVYHSRGRTFRLSQVRSVERIDFRGWYAIYRIEVDMNDGKSTSGESEGIFRSEVLDIRTRKKERTGFESSFLDKLEHGSKKTGLLAWKWQAKFQAE